MRIAIHAPQAHRVQLKVYGRPKNAHQEHIDLLQKRMDLDVSVVRKVIWMWFCIYMNMASMLHFNIVYFTPISGTWSKNWQLREKGECTRCPTGT